MIDAFAKSSNTKSELLQTRTDPVSIQGTTLNLAETLDQIEAKQLNSLKNLQKLTGKAKQQFEGMDTRRYSILRKIRKSFLVKNAITAEKDIKENSVQRNDSTMTFLDQLKHKKNFTPEINISEFKIREIENPNEKPNM